MIIIAICVLIGGLIWIVLDDSGDFFGLLVLSALGFILGTILSLTLGLLFEKEGYIQKTYSLVSTKDSVVSVGRLFLGTGHIDGELKYFFYRKNGKSIVGDSVGSANTYIYEDGLNNPRIDYFEPKFKIKLLNYLFLPTEEGFVEIHIPPKSITTEYKFDLQ